MNKRRLLKLADLLEADAKNRKGVRFDINYIGLVDKSEFWDHLAAPEDVKLDCGTTACAMGLAAISGAFKREGLGFKIEGPWIETTWNGRKSEFDKCAERLFGISNKAANWLFTDGGYEVEGIVKWDNLPKGAKGERMVAKRIRDFVAGKLAP